MRKQELEREVWDENFESPEKYVTKKLKMLWNDMYIDPTREEINHLHSLTTQTAIDNAVRSIISRHWGNGE